MVFTLFLFISSLGFANKCIDLYSVKYKSGLDKLKASVLDIANHPQIRNRTLRLDSKGEQIRFFNPIFHHILNKAARIFSQIPKGDTRLNIQSEFDDFIDKTLKKWNEGNFTYNDLIDLPLQVAVFFHEDWTQNQHLEGCIRLCCRWPELFRVECQLFFRIRLLNRIVPYR